MASKDQIIYRLSYLSRYDDEGQVFIGYIPRLQLYTQARSKERLRQALDTTATQFILACANKGILMSVLRESGAHVSERVSSDEVKEKAKKAEKLGGEFVAVLGYQESTETIEVSVPMSLISQREAVAVA